MRTKVIAKSLILILSTAWIFLTNGCGTTPEPTQKEEVKEALNIYFQGETAERQKELEAAQDYYLQSIEISPRPRAYYRLAEVQLALGKVNEARASAEAALRLSPAYQQPRLFLQQLSSQEASARPEILQPQPMEDRLVIETLPAETSVVPPPAEDTQTQQIPSEPVRSAPPVAQISPLSPDAQGLLDEARQASAAGDWQRTLDLTDRILQEYPDHPRALHARAYALFQQGNLPEAEETFRQVVTLEPTFADAWNDLGVTLEKMGRSSESIAAYESALALGEHPDALFNLALLREKMGEYKTAVELYDRYIKFDSVSAYANFARERLSVLRRNAF